MTFKWTTLGECYDVRDGTHSSPKYVDSGFPLVTSKNLKNGRIDLKKIKYISEKDYKMINKRSAVSVGDVLMAMIGTIGNPVEIIEPLKFAIKNVALFKTNKEQSSAYLCYFLNHPKTVQRMMADAKGTTQKFVGLGYLRKFPISLPPLAEQQSIVAKLDAVFAEIDKTIKINFDKFNYIDVLKNSVLNNQLGNNLIKLGEACDLIKRGISPKYLEIGGIAVINQKCIRNHKIDFSNARRHNIDIKKVPEERFIRKGDVLINSTGHGTLGRVAQVLQEPLEKTTVDSHVTIIRPKKKLFNLNFFSNSLIKIEKKLEAAGEGTSGQTELSRSKLENEFFIPFIKSIDKQKKISFLLDSMFERAFILKDLTTKIIKNMEALKSSLLLKELGSK